MPKPVKAHCVKPTLLRERVSIVVVGCGGTGSAVLSGLPYLHHAMLAAGHPHGLHVWAIDGDRITETNCVRQPFASSEIGLYKATALIHRLNLFWGLRWQAVPTHVRCGRDLPDCDFVISCVDTRAARATVARVVRLKSRRFSYWLDTGNNASTGQFVLGEPLRRDRKDRSARLPCVDELFPQITKGSLDARDLLPACSAAESLIRQEPYINQVIAQHALAAGAAVSSRLTLASWRLRESGFRSHSGIEQRF
jgi:PRTRC genetic system ThiF family protein